MRNLTALAALAATTAFAQSSVTLSGGVGVALQKTTGDAVSQFAQTDGWLNFAATEDLGGGLSLTASQQIAQNGRGGTVNAEDTKLSLKGGFGAVNFYNFNAASNMLGSLASLQKDVNYALGGDAHLSYLQYVAPAFSGVTLSVASYQNKWAPGADRTSSGLDTNSLFSSTKYATAYKAAYAQGPLTAALEYRQHDGRTRVWAGYDLGVAKLDAATEINYKDNAANKKQSEFGVVAPINAAITLGLHYGQKDDVKLGTNKGTEVAAVYALSKRTNVNLSYGDLQRVTADKLSNGAVPFNGKSSRVRLLHTF